ncbi:MAG: DUF2721 domain-containing protein [Erysipelothrix sp.]|nr:DUF2721 domain-containing protein [Erysipelothrix sp.]
MNIDLQTPSLVFSATSLLMLAYTNRFLTIAGLTRDLINTHHTTKDGVILNQISNLQIRMDLIRKMQLFGAFSFTAAIASMLLQMFSIIPISIAAWVFIASLIFLLISLLYLVKELQLSNDALTYQLKTLKEEKTN